MTDALGVDTQRGDLRYALFVDRASTLDVCPSAQRPDADACAIDSWALSTQPLHLHEIVHVALISGGFVGPVSLQEGLATALGCDLGMAGEVTQPLPREWLADTELFQEHAVDAYPAAGSFVSFLLDAHGEAAVLELMLRTGPGDDLGRVDAVANEVLGRSLSEALAEWSTMAPQPWYRICRRVYECGADPLPASGAVTLTRGLSDRIGRGGLAGTLRVETTGELHVTASAFEPGIQVVSCERRPDVMREFPGGRELDASSTIEPGLYALWLTAGFLDADDAEVEAELSVEVR